MHTLLVHPTGFQAVRENCIHCMGVIRGDAGKELDLLHPLGDLASCVIVFFFLWAYDASQVPCPRHDFDLWVGALSYEILRSSEVFFFHHKLRFPDAQLDAIRWSSCEDIVKRRDALRHPS